MSGKSSAEDRAGRVRRGPRASHPAIVSAASPSRRPSKTDLVPVLPRKVLRVEEEWPPRGSVIARGPTATAFGDFVWYSAVAWICTLDLSFAEEVHRGACGSDMSRQAALALLDQRLAERKFLHIKRRAAEAELMRALPLGILTARAERPRGAVPQSAWDFGEFLPERRHDELVDFESGAVTSGIRLAAKPILARFQPPVADRLVRLGGTEWSKAATVYWVQHGTHRGFVRSTSVRSYRAKMAEITDALRAGTIKCQAAMRADTPGLTGGELSMVARNAAFWTGRGLADAEEAIFTAAEVTKKWPGGYVQAARESRGKQEAKKRLIEEFGMPYGDAKKAADEYAPDGRQKAGVKQGQRGEDEG